MMKEEFEFVFDSFENEDIKKFAEDCVNKAPDYWHHVAASSTGKYHPSYALGEAGLVRHTIAAIRFLNHMFGVESIANQFSSRERDLLRVAALSHDMMKSGTQEEFERNKYTKHEHPVLAANMIKSMSGLNKEELDFIAHAIESHMGQWNTARNSKVVLPKPQDKYQIILHLADYLASRKDIEVLFSSNNDKISNNEKPVDLNAWKIDFGKYSGKTLKEIAEIDKGYLEWASGNIKKEPAASYIKKYLNLIK